MILTGPFNPRAFYEAKALKSKLSEILLNHDYRMTCEVNLQNICCTRKPTRTALKILLTVLWPLRMT